MTKYLRVRTPEFMDRSQANALEILDLYTVIIKESQNENQLRNISVKDIYQFDQIFKPTVSNIEIYAALIQYNIDKFIDLQPQRIILRGDQKSGRTYTLVGMPQDPGLLLIFTGHLFYKLEEQKKKESNSNYELRYNYKIFLKCYIKEENQKTYDLLSNSTESMVDHESVISFDNQLQFLKLLRIILRNVDQRNFRDPKQYHQFQQTQSRFNLRETTFDFILERQSTNWNGQQKFQNTNFKFVITEMKSPLNYFSGDILIYFVNPATKFIASTKNLLKEASLVKVQKGINQISEEIVKNQLNFVIKSMKQFDTKEHIEQMQTLVTQFKKEVERINEILDIKQEIVEKVQTLLRVDISLMAKLIYSTDVREFLMSKFQLYQVTESFNELKEVREQIDVLYRRLKRLLRQKTKMLQPKLSEQQEDFKTKLISDIKRNIQSIKQYLKVYIIILNKQLISQEQYRGHNYEKLKNQIFTQFIEPIPELILPEPDSPKQEINQEQTILPKIQKTRRLNKNHKQKQISLNDSLINEKGNIFISMQSSKRNQESSIFSSPRLKTDKSIYPKMQKQQNTKNHNILQCPYTLDIDLDSIQQNEWKYSFSKSQDYKKLNSNTRVFRNNELILDTMSQLDKFVVQNNIIKSTDIIRDFQKKTKFATEIKKFKIPNLSNQYIEGIEKVNELNFNTIKF